MQGPGGHKPFGHALGVISLGRGIQLASFHGLGRRVLSVFHGVVHSEG